MHNDIEYYKYIYFLFNNSIKIAHIVYFQEKSNFTNISLDNITI